MTEPDDISLASPMREVLARHPGARRALFIGWKVGGSSGPEFKPDEALEAVLARLSIGDPAAALAAIKLSAETDEKLWIGAGELAKRLKAGSARLVDLRSPQEHRLVRLEGSVLASPQVLKEALDSWPKDSLIVVYDHLGVRALDGCAYLVGHGFALARALRGGIDAWSREVDPLTPRYG